MHRIKRDRLHTLGPKAAAITRAGWRLRKAEANREMFTASPRMAEIEHQLQYLKKDHAHRVSNKESARPQIRADAKSNLAATGDAHRSESKRKTLRGGCAWSNHALPITEIDLLEIVPGRGLHIRTRQESWLISLPEELQSNQLLQAITSGEVNCLSGSCELYDLSSDHSKSTSSIRERDFPPNLFGLNLG